MSNWTYNEHTTLFKCILLERCLMQGLDKVSVRTLRTNLILHHGISDILNQATKLLHVLSIFQELRDHALLCQWGKGFENIIQFPDDFNLSNQPHRPWPWGCGPTTLGYFSSLSPCPRHQEQVLLAIAPDTGHEVSMIQSSGGRPPHSRAIVSIQNQAVCQGGPNLAVVKDEAQCCRSRFERRKGIRGLFDPTEDEFCPGRCEGLDV